MGLFSSIFQDDYTRLDQQMFGAGRKRPPCLASMNYPDMARGWEKTFKSNAPSLRRGWDAKHTVAVYYLSMLVGCHMYKWVTLRDLGNLERQASSTGNGMMTATHVIAISELTEIEAEASQLESALHETLRDSFSTGERDVFRNAWREFSELDEKNVLEMLNDCLNRDAGGLSRAYLEGQSIKKACGPLLKM